MSEEVVVSHEQLTELCVRKLMNAGVDPEPSGIVADVLVHANLRGVDSHGVIRMEHYANKIAHGGINPKPELTITDTGPVTAVVDGDDGLGHYTVKKAMDHAIVLARQNGLGFVGIRNSSHCGALSYYVTQAANANMIGIAMTNTDKIVVPFGGTEAFFGTNPMAFGFPSRHHPPVILDMATSSVAYGKILTSLEKRQSIPADWAVNRQGEPITDPKDFSALLPFGGAKGYGLSMVVDIFAGILTGSPYGPHIPPMYGAGADYSVKRKLGHFVGAIDVSRFTDSSSFLNHMDTLIEEVHAVPPAPTVRQVEVPGEREYGMESTRRKDGIKIPRSIYNFLTTG